MDPGQTGELRKVALVKKIKKDTKLTLTGRKPFENYGIVNPPIYRTSTVLFKNTKELGKAIANRFNQTYYGRYGTPTTFALEDGIAEIENGYRTIATSSGMSSISISLLSLLSKDDHCLISDCTYYPTKKFAVKILSKFVTIRKDEIKTKSAKDSVVEHIEDNKIILQQMKQEVRERQK